MVSWMISLCALPRGERLRFVTVQSSVCIFFGSAGVASPVELLKIESEVLSWHALLSPCAEEVIWAKLPCVIGGVCGPHAKLVVVLPSIGSNFKPECLATI